MTTSPNFACTMIDGKNAKIGFVGLGRMGANMARRLHEVGCHVAIVYDRDPAAGSDLARELGSRVAVKLRDVTAACNVIFTVITDDAAMHSIFASAGDSLLESSANTLFINCATLSPSVQREIGAKIAQAGASALEACMASSIPQAREGSLYLICAGELADFERAEPLLRLLGTPRYVGAAGKAAEVKALVNMLMNINTAGLAEALGLGEALDIDLTTLREIFSQTGARSRVLETDAEDMQTQDHTVFFSAAHAAKDSGIALSLADQIGLDLPLARATKEQYDRLTAMGFGELDKSAIAMLTFRGRASESAR